MHGMKKKRELKVAILLGSRRRRLRLPDGTKMIEVHKFENSLVLHKERFVLMEYPIEEHWNHEDYEKVEVRHYARVSYRTYKAVQKQIGESEFAYLLAKAQIA